MPQELSNWYRDNFKKLSASPEDDVWRSISSRLDASAAESKKSNFKRPYIFIWFIFLIPLLSALLIFRGNGHSAVHYFALVSSATNSAQAEVNSETNPAGSRWITNNLLTFFPSPVSVGCMGQTTGLDHKREYGSSAIDPFIAEQTFISPGINGKMDQRIQSNKTTAPEKAQLAETASLVNKTDMVHSQWTANETDIRTFLFLQPGFYTLSRTVSPAASILSPVDNNSNPNEEQVTRPRHSYVGIYGSVKISYLLNDQTYSALSRHGFDQTHLVFAPGFGIRYGYYFSSAFNLEAQLNLRDQFSQRYSIYREGIIHEEAVTLNGYSVGLTARLHSAHILNRELYLVAGGQCLFVRTFVSQDSRYGTTEDNFRRIYPLITVGAEQELLSFRNYLLLVGLRTNVGFSNVIGRNQQYYSELNQTRLSDLNVYFSVQRTLACKK